MERRKTGVLKNVMNLSMSLTLLSACLFLSSSCAGSRHNEGEVYICTGPSATVYHKTDECKGLLRCSRAIESISLDEAESMGRRPCKICY